MRVDIFSDIYTAVLVYYVDVDGSLSPCNSTDRGAVCLKFSDIPSFQVSRINVPMMSELSTVMPSLYVYAVYAHAGKTLSSNCIGQFLL